MLANTEDFIFQDQGGADTLVSIKEEGGAYRASLIIGVAAKGDKRAEGTLMLKIVSGRTDRRRPRRPRYGHRARHRLWRLVPERRLGQGHAGPARPAVALSELTRDAEADPSQRTEWNVRDTGRLMVPIDSAGLAVSKGTGLAIGTAKKLGKPNIVIDMDAGGAGVLAMGFVGEGQGPRRSALPARAKARPRASMPRPAPFSAACCGF